MNIHDYLIDQTGLDWPALLEEWRWLLPPEFTVWLFTRAGDLFIQVPDDSIWIQWGHRNSAPFFVYGAVRFTN